MNAAFTNLLQRYGARRDEPLAPHTFLKIGGPADWFLTVETNEMLIEVVRAAREEGCSMFTLGAGTNTLVGDAGVRGLVIQQRCAAFDVPDYRSGDEIAVIEVDAGTLFTTLSRTLSAVGWAGIEWAEGIPGSMGGAVVYNAGAYGGCLRDVLVDLECIDRAGELQRLGRGDVHLSYRSSDFTRGRLADWMITRVRIRLRRGNPTYSARLLDEIAERRRRAAPRGLSGGSTFRNPTGHRAWQLIDSVGLCGHRIGGAEISREHCNYFMNVHNASAADMAALMRLAQERVYQKHGVRMEPELTSVGEGFG